MYVAGDPWDEAEGLTRGAARYFPIIRDGRPNPPPRRGLPKVGTTTDLAGIVDSMLATAISDTASATTYAPAESDPEDVAELLATTGGDHDAEEAEELGLVTFALDDIDWDDEVRVFFEERTSFSPDGLTGMEANLRFVGPETMESKIFSRLTAWQNWIFQRPNAVGEDGALRRYGTGQKAQFDMTRV